MLSADSIRKHKIASEDKKTKQSNNISENIRYLCNKESSISEVCRNLEINRQQFNKYLSGISRPSNANLVKICRYFNCSESKINLPHDQFLENLNSHHPLKKEIFPKPLMEFLNVAYPTADEELKRYQGFYHVYYHSMAFPGYIAKSLAHFYFKEGLMFCKTIERMSKIEEEHGPQFTFKYFGTVSLISDRLYISEIESLLKKNLFMTTLYPSYQPRLQFLNGINTGVASTHGRDPACRYITYEFLGTHINKRESLKSCALFKDNSDKVADEIRNRLNPKESPDSNIFFAGNYI